MFGTSGLFESPPVAVEPYAEVDPARGRLFFAVRPAGRTYFEVKVPFSLGKRKS